MARGARPLTPGDASFRTTAAEAAPALAGPFRLTYSLGEIVRLGTADTADNQGFVAAAGGFAPEPASDPACTGAVNRGAATAGCSRQGAAESYWATAAGAVP